MSDVIIKSKEWTPAIDKLLRRWMKQIGERHRAHLNQSRKFNRRHYMLGLPAVILSIITTTSTLATFQDGASYWEYIRLGMGVISVGSSAFTAGVTFLNYQESAEKHKTAADNYDSLYRVISTLLLLPYAQRGDPIGTLQNIRSQYDDNIKTYPPLPKKYDKHLTYKVSEEERKKASQKPDLNNVLTTQTQINLDEVLNAEDRVITSSNGITNEYSNGKLDINTSEDEIEIPFDLDEEEISGVMSNMDILGNAKINPIQKNIDNSIAKTLEYEKNRLEMNSTPES